MSSLSHVLSVCGKPLTTLLICLGLVCLGAPLSGAQNTELLRGGIYAPAPSPSNPNIVAYERQIESQRGIYLIDLSSGGITQVSVDDADVIEDENDFFAGFGGSEELERLEGFDTGLAWRPVLDSRDRQWFAFVSSGDGSGYGLYLWYVDTEGMLGEEGPFRIPFDGATQHPAWSANGKHLIFSGSERQGQGAQLYLARDIVAAHTQQSFPSSLIGAQQLRLPATVDITQVTDLPGNNVFPQWAPVGNHVVFQGEMNEAPTLFIVRIAIGSSQPVQAQRLLPEEQLNQYKPTWAPDGRRVAFYANAQRPGVSDEVQDVRIAAVDVSPSGDFRSATLLAGSEQRELARNVLVHEQRGPQWMPHEGQRAIVYVNKEEGEGNPIVMALPNVWEVSPGSRNGPVQRNLVEELGWGTRFHEEVTVDHTRVLFAAQSGDQLELMWRELPHVEGAQYTIPKELSQGAAMRRSAAIPGWGQLYKGQPLRAAGFLVATGVATGLAVDSFSRFYGSRSKAEETVPPDSGWRDHADTMRGTGLVFAGTAVALWALNVADSSLGFPRMGERPIRIGDTIAATPDMGLTSQADAPAYRLSIKLSF
jgi:hypothetical protein